MNRARCAALAAAAAAAVPAGAAAALLGAGAAPGVAPVARAGSFSRPAVGPGFLAVVPNVLGMRVGSARAMVGQTRLRFAETRMEGHGPTGSDLRVAGMRPAPGSRVGLGSFVHVILAERPRGEVVPGVQQSP
jgi:hypothetical protein